MVAWLGLWMDRRRWKKEWSEQQRLMAWEGRQLGNMRKAAEAVAVVAVAAAAAGAADVAEAVEWVVEEELEDRRLEMWRNGVGEDGS